MCTDSLLFGFLLSLNTLLFCKFCHSLFTCNAVSLCTLCIDTIEFCLLTCFIHIGNLYPLVKSCLCISLYLSGCSLISLELRHICTWLYLADSFLRIVNILGKLCHHAFYIFLCVVSVFHVLYYTIPCGFGVSLFKQWFSILALRNTLQCGFRLLWQIVLNSFITWL